jgi:YbbR domain-containing protein
MSKIFVNDNGVDIEATGEVLQNIMDFQAKCKLEKSNQEAEAEAKAQAKTDLLERLGITADEAKLLLA